MIVEVEMRVPAAPPFELREAVMARAPRAGVQTCPRCGVDRFHLLDALCDLDCWENRALAASLVRGCRTCGEEVAAAIAGARLALTEGEDRIAYAQIPAK